ncbi:MAG: metallophosphoesterase [Candidatus Woesearchaeota archaeon]
MVRILAVSDEELISGREAVIDNYVTEDIDVLLNCGDVSPSYLEYIIMKFKPMNTIMVHGNHDKVFYAADKDKIEDDNGFSGVYQGSYVLTDGLYQMENPNDGTKLNICGFSGAYAYGEWPFYYDEKRASKFVKSLGMKDFFNNLDQLDIMMSHSAPKIDDYLPDVDHHHRPSEEIAQIHKKFKPRMWFYGHIHPRYTDEELDHKIEDEGSETYLINAVPFKVIEYDKETGDVSIINSFDKEG